MNGAKEEKRDNVVEEGEKEYLFISFFIILLPVGIRYIYIKVYFVKNYGIDISADLGTSSNYKRVKLLD